MKKIVTFIRKKRTLSNRHIRKFMKKVNGKASVLNMKDSFFTTPSGIGDETFNVSTARDLMQLMLAASKIEALNDIWCVKTKQIEINGENSRKLLVSSTLNSSAVDIAYPILSGKTGTWGNSCHIAAISNIDNKPIITIVLGAESDENRFKAINELMNISAQVLKEPTYDVERACIAYADAAISCSFTDDDFCILFEQNADKQFPAASLTKILTVITALDYIRNSKEFLTIKSCDLINDLHTHFQKGDVLSIHDILYAMLLPSSNQAATALARYIGKYFL